MAGIIETAMDGIVSIDAEQRIVLLNPAAERMFGYRAADLLGRPLDVLIPEGLRATHRQHVVKFGQTGATARAMGALGTVSGLRASGEEFPLEASISQTTIGRSKLYTAILRDITMRRQAESRIERHLAQLAALRTIDTAISSSFDLRLTLNVLLEQVTTQLGVDAAGILLLHAPTQTLEYAAGRGFRSPAIQRARLRLGEGLAGRAALERQTVHVPDFHEVGGDSARAAELGNEGFVTYFGTPLVAKGQVRGVLELFHRSAFEPDEEWHTFLHTLAGQAAIAIDDIQMFEGLQRSNLELALAYDVTLEGWSRAMDLRDRETEGHTRRVTDLTLRIARTLGLADEELAHVRRGALLHDVGKLGIPDAILLKPGALTEEEWAVMRKHPLYAYEWLSPIAYLRPALAIPWCHHEKWDGSGYPRGLRAETIPLPARVFTVVDVYDALTSDRPYRKAWRQEDALQHIEEFGGVHFDPAVVPVFLASVQEAGPAI
jgi:PAS domain S-box-containing protein